MNPLTSPPELNAVNLSNFPGKNTKTLTNPPQVIQFIMTDINFNYINSNILEVIKNDLELQSQLDSQGFHSFNDGTCAFSHDSSYPLECLLDDKKVFWQKRINMDRGGVGFRENRRFACICDGLNGNGFLSAFAAQAVVNYLMNSLDENPIGKMDLHKAQKLVIEATFYVKEKFNLLQDKELSGATTVLFADCIPQGNLYEVHAAALGDGAIFHLNHAERTSKQLNTIYREIDPKTGKPDLTTTGGYINTLGQIGWYNHLNIANIEISKEDFIVLVTDGFLDNVYPGTESEVLSLVAYSFFFDQPFEDQMAVLQPFQNKQAPLIPTIEILKKCMGSFVGDGNEKLSAEIITKRISSYVRLATYAQAKLEEEFYVKEANLHTKLRELDFRLLHMNLSFCSQKNEEIRKSISDEMQKMIPKLAIYGVELTQTTHMLTEILKCNRDGKPKIDDAMIIVFSPQ